MALAANENKVKFGLKNVHYAVATIAEDGSATFGTPVKFPGARNLSLEPKGGGEPWYADDGVYFFDSGISNRTGSLEMARMIDQFKKDVLGYILDSKGVLLADMNPETVHFALLFEISGDRKARRFVEYNCVATPPTTGSATTEGSKNPQTETTNLTSMGIYVPGFEKWLSHGQTSAETDAAAYASWYESVYVPTPPAQTPGDGE